MFQPGDIVDILNPTGEWIIAGHAKVIIVNGKHGDSYNIATRKGMQDNIPAYRVQSARLICPGCEADCNSFCGWFDMEANDWTVGWGNKAPRKPQKNCSR